MPVRGARQRPFLVRRYAKIPLLLAAVFAIWQWWPRSVAVEPVQADSETAVGDPIVLPSVLATLSPADAVTIVGEGDTLADVFEGHDVPYTEIVLLERASVDVFPLTNIQVGKTVEFSFSAPDSAFRLAQVRYQPDANRLIIANQNEAGWVVVEERIVYDVRQTARVGAVEASLYASAMAQGLPEKIIMQVADIFAWDIDFARDTANGDSYRVLYEEKYLDGVLITTGRVLAAAYTNRGEDFQAYFFQPEGGDPAYYTTDGAALQRAFLKAPVNFRYVSSGFSNARFHPVLGKVLPHDGVDYAADYGVPIISVGEGVVARYGWSGGYGNRIEIRHNERYGSQYSHMSSYVKGLRVGDRVSQGQVIGYVGSTGFSTGNHVHFSMTEYGSYVDPSNVDAPAGKPLDEQYRPAFDLLVAEWKAILDQESL